MKNEVNRALVAKKKLTILFAALTLSVGLWAANSVITFTSTSNLDLNPNAFLDANDQVLTFTIDYDESTHAGTITVNGKLVKIAYQAFSNCTALTSITLPKGVTSIGGHAFYRCTALTSITLPEGVTSIGEDAFLNCTALTSVILPESVTSIGEAAFASTALTSITLPEGVTAIGESTFSQCSALTSITLPEGVTSIGSAAFSYCPLSSVTIPANVTYLGHFALGNNSSLADVYVAWTTTLPTVEINPPFSKSSINNATLHVPFGSLELYQNADVWKGFGTFVEYDPLPNIKTAAIAAVNAKIAESDNDNVKAIATSAATAINAATTIDATTTIAEVNTLKRLALAAIASAKAAYNDGKTEVLGSMGDECTDCTAVKVTNGTTTVTLYNATGVDYEVIED
ncbi:MAG: leucine-rich repeat domain-containing protein [Paludibacteraceae bacterium]|nr:leucine-rich repeat domain-containing protein [Paludibacteraceae bacterium]